MFQNAELEIFIMILLLLIIISMIPLIELKYQSDLWDCPSKLAIPKTHLAWILGDGKRLP